MPRIWHPSIERHAEIARDIREAEGALLKVLHHSTFYYARETDRLLKSLDRGLGCLKSRLEETMFHDYPKVGREWISLYYGPQADADELMREQGEHAERHCRRAGFRPDAERFEGKEE